MLSMDHFGLLWLRSGSWVLLLALYYHFYLLLSLVMYPAATICLSLSLCLSADQRQGVSVSQLRPRIQAQGWTPLSLTAQLSVWVTEGTGVSGQDT